MEVNMETLHGDMIKIQQELDLIKNVLLFEGELTDWAKSELKRAREEDESEYVSLETTKKRILKNELLNKIR